MQIFVICTLSAQVSVSVGTTSYSINPSLLGLNGRSTEGPSWTNATFIANVAEMNPAYVRYPAGTQGNQWNWKTGTFIASLGQSAQEIFTIPMFINGLPSGAKIIYMVNMVLPTEQTGITFSTTTDAVLATENTLSAKLTDILNAIDAFDKAGHLPEVCELGNELYFSNVHAGVYANNPTFYLQHAKIIAQSIKNKYPGIKIILCTTKGGTTSRDNWNNTIFNALNTDGTLRALVHGVVQHHYINDTYGTTSAVTTSAIAHTIIDEGVQYVLESAADYAIVPTGIKLWFTEYGATKPSADGMWCAGLRLATMSLQFMKMGEKVDNLLWHHITDDPNILSYTTKDKLGPAGIAFAQLSKAINGASSYKKLTFSNMTPNDDYAELSGYKFFANGEERILILNIGSTSYSNLNLNTLTGNGTLNFAKQYWSATPYTTFVTTSSNISVNNSTSLTAYTVNPFSITTLVKKLNTTVVDYQESNVQIFPEIIKQTVTVSCAENCEITIADLTGKVIYCSALSAGEHVLNASIFAKGLNLIRVGTKVFKVIRE